MSKHNDSKNQGVTLLEMLFVMVGLAILLTMLLTYTTQKAFDNRVQRTSDQIQNIMVAAQAYYMKNNGWPPSIAAMQAAGYLPGTVLSPFGGNAYDVTTNATSSLFYVSVLISGTTNVRNIATNVAGRLPIAYLSNVVVPVGVPAAVPCPVGGTNCRVVAAMNVPAQALNNARQITYSGIVHHGGCIPVMPCPVAGSGWTPQIMVAPVSVSGVNRATQPREVYPISSFTAYATGGVGSGTNPPACVGGTFVQCPAPTGFTDYWRVCMQVMTVGGNVASTNTSRWGQYVSAMAITRCTNSNNTEQSGSNFNTYTR